MMKVQVGPVEFPGQVLSVMNPTANTGQLLCIGITSAMDVGAITGDPIQGESK